MQLHNFPVRRLVGAAALACAAALIPATASAATAGTPSSPARPAHPVTAYVVNYGSVTPITTTTGKAGKEIKVPLGPGPIAITPNGKTAYVVNAGTFFVRGHTVTPIRTATNTALKPIKVGILDVTVGESPDAIAITPNGKTAYVANAGPSTVTPITTATNEPGKAIKASGQAPAPWRSPLTGRPSTSSAPDITR